MKENVYFGGCHCGNIRYCATGSPFNTTHCHCNSCRKTSGAPYLSWTTFLIDQVIWQEGQPKHYDSSTNGQRFFCPDCGTHLAFKSAEAPEEIDLTLASMDYPDRFFPDDHVWAANKLPWIKPGDGLPRFSGSRGSAKLPRSQMAD